MSFTGYVVDTSVLAQIPKGVQWHAETSRSDPTKSLVAIEWDNPSFGADFESLPGVIPLGDQWEPVPADAVAVLASFQPEQGVAKGLSVPDQPVVADTVSAALKKTTWAMARLVR